MSFDLNFYCGDVLLGGWDGLFAWAAELGLTKADVDRHGPSALDRVAADMQLGNALGLDGTPYVFVNASLVDEMPTRAVLSAAVRNALAV